MVVYMTRDEKTTSKIMKKIKSTNTSIEVKLRKALWNRGYRYRKNYKELPGTPDIVIIKYKIAVFCEKLKVRLEDGKNPNYWIKKIERNRKRDMNNDKKLFSLGWTVIHFWGSDIMKNTEECIKAIEEAIVDRKVESYID